MEVKRLRDHVRPYQIFTESKSSNTVGTSLSWYAQVVGSYTEKVLGYDYVGRHKEIRKNWNLCVSNNRFILVVSVPLYKREPDLRLLDLLTQPHRPNFVKSCLPSFSGIINLRTIYVGLRMEGKSLFVLLTSVPWTRWTEIQKLLIILYPEWFTSTYLIIWFLNFVTIEMFRFFHSTGILLTLLHIGSSCDIIPISILGNSSISSCLRSYLLVQFSRNVSPVYLRLPFRFQCVSSFSSRTYTGSILRHPVQQW